MKAHEWIEKIRNHALDRKFAQLYGENQIKVQVERYCDLLKKMMRSYPEDDVRLFSTPGRTEISGNHTDHNHGKVIAAGIHLDSIAAVAACPEPMVTLVSAGYITPFIVDLSQLEVQTAESGTTNSLIRGIAARLAQKQLSIGGFRGFLTSNVLPGSGLSSSAAVEVLIATIFNHLYNHGTIAPLELARICQYAENSYFGKPCGLMDQAACAFGGITAFDFLHPAAVAVQQLVIDFQKFGYALVVVNTGGSHADLTQAYAAIPGEMKLVAEILGQEVCREVDYRQFIARLPQLREKTGDRALLRYLHFYHENLRVDKQIALLKSGRIPEYLQEVAASGSSSWRLLQNCYEPSDPLNQGICLGLALTREFLEGDGAARVHGGGFAGTIQAYIPVAKLESYITYMEAVFGKDTVIPLRIRPEGTACLGAVPD